MAMLGGRAVGRYTREPRPEPTVAADGQAQHFTAGAPITADWWRLFEPAQLDAVVRQAIANNPTLQAAKASLRPSQDNMRAGHGVFFQQIQAGLDASRQRTAPLLESSQTPDTIFNLVIMSGIISYALDGFDGGPRTVENLRQCPMGEGEALR
jgi:outer membrane protein TolC